ncbi:Fe2+-enterobactin ABC transporter substrate-binding protein [Rhodococcus sp. HNM0569]|uniref:Fe2+-enterobactin ABC transporter substrate-binding protein n=1 Tax=Rhodococcus sp. HNM0569 TaxID=2716340 RepID=UPI001469C952|nr:Fe2+-enterobactin ABC transporter substrate-binding protein [Rhodococcus sp. HNM0569]NLU83471.1 Fe2+-enterobactin ABC transporter substrate-binding protein [Rhodococcus sp. HNM0569]
MLRRTIAVLAALTLAGGVAACSSSDESADDTAVSTSTGDWPRTVSTERGDITIEQQPERIVSTSVTLTGSLLALDAPLAGTAAQPPSTVTDDRGLFTQWADVATDRNLDVLYQGQPNVEAITAAEPDLIFVSASGADSALDQYDVLSKIAPVVVVRYDDKSWEETTEQVAAAIGAEQQADDLLASFDDKIDKAKEALGPEVLSSANPVNTLTYNSPKESKIFTAESAQGELLARLGLTTAELPAEIAAAGPGGAMGKRSDIVSVAQENLSRALPGNTTFVIAAEDDAAERLLSDATLRETPSVVAGHVYALGTTSFRLDYYSASDMIDRVVDVLT